MSEYALFMRNIHELSRKKSPGSGAFLIYISLKLIIESSTCRTQQGELPDVNAVLLRS